MRLIDADKLLEMWKYSESDDLASITKIQIEIMKQSIKEAPTVDSEVVIRCKDCKYFQSILCAFDMIHIDEKDENGFCSYGERKDG